MNSTEFLQKSKIPRFFRPFYGGLAHIFLFHRVYNEYEKPSFITKGLQVSKKYLEDVILYCLSENIDIISLDESYKRLSSAKKIKRFVSFTFDDGYEDNLLNALPVFERYEVPFSIFIASGFPDHKAILWWYLLEDLIMNNKSVHFEYENCPYSYNTQTIEQKFSAFAGIRSFILDSNLNSILPKLQALFPETKDFYELTRRLSLNWKQVKELHEHPLVTIGAHTVHHLPLNTLETGVAIEEISKSVDRIEQIIQSSVEYFAYPIGTQREASIREYDLAKKIGFKLSFSAIRQNVNKHHLKNLQAIPRIGLNERIKIPNIDLYLNGVTSLRDKILGYTNS